MSELVAIRLNKSLQRATSVFAFVDSAGCSSCVASFFPHGRRDASAFRNSGGLARLQPRNTRGGVAHLVEYAGERALFSWCPSNKSLRWRIQTPGEFRQQLSVTFFTHSLGLAALAIGVLPRRADTRAHSRGVR